MRHESRSPSGRPGPSAAAARAPDTVARRGTSYVSCREPGRRKVDTGELDNGLDRDHLGVEVEHRPQLHRVGQDELVAVRRTLGQPGKGLLGGVLEELGVGWVGQRVYSDQPRVGRAQFVLPEPHLQLIPAGQPTSQDPRQPDHIKVQLVRRPLTAGLERLSGASAASGPGADMPPSQNCHTQTLTKPGRGPSGVISLRAKSGVLIRPESVGGLGKHAVHESTGSADVTDG